MSVQKGLLSRVTTGVLTLPNFVLRWSDRNILPNIWSLLEYDLGTLPEFFGALEYDLTKIPKCRKYPIQHTLVTFDFFFRVDNAQV